MDHAAQFEQLDTAIVAINPATPEAHRKYRQKLGLPFRENLQGEPFPLLSDQDMSVCRKFGALKASAKGVERTVVVVDKGGVIRYLKKGMPPSRDILEAIRAF